MHPSAVNVRTRKAGIALLAGGEATRLPGKLALDAGGVPMLVRIFDNVATGREVFVSCKGTFSRDIDAVMTAPLVVDRWPRRGPLGGLCSTMARMRSRFVVAIAGDAPLVGSSLIETLEAAQQEGDEAVVPLVRTSAGERLEPLAALYDRLAFLREAYRELQRGASVVALVQRLRLRTVAMQDPSPLRSINTPSEYAAFQASLEER